MSEVDEIHNRVFLGLRPLSSDLTISPRDYHCLRRLALAMEQMPSAAAPLVDPMSRHRAGAYFPNVIIGTWPEDGSTYEMKIPQQLRPAMIALLQWAKRAKDVTSEAANIAASVKPAVNTSPSGPGQVVFSSIVHLEMLDGLGPGQEKYPVHAHFIAGMPDTESGYCTIQVNDIPWTAREALKRHMRGLTRNLRITIEEVGV